MPGHDIIVIGASAGGVETLTQLAKALPPDLQAAVFVVLHVPAHGTSVMPNILNRAGPLRSLHPKDGERIVNGHMYVAPPNNHLLIERGYIRLAQGPKENGYRPAVDTMFRTAARAYGRRVVGVILSGTLDDGTAGLAAVKKRGGIAVVQKPEEALFQGMPRSAIENVAVDYILPVSEIAIALVRLVDEIVEEGEPPVSNEMDIECDMAELKSAAMQKIERPGIPSGFGCPDCGGVLWELHEEDLLRFRCRVGHAWSADSLLAQQSEGLEEALWIALRTLEESGALAGRLAQRARDRSSNRVAARFEDEAREAKQRAEVIREVLLKGQVNGKKEEPYTEGDSNEYRQPEK